MISDRIVMAKPRPALERLKRSLSGYMSRNRAIYIGATNDPEARWFEHRERDHRWREMFLLYEAFNPVLAAHLERELIAYVRATRFRIDCRNVGSGGEGLRPGPSIVLYALLR